MKVNIESTADGSPTLYRKDIDEHYHSIKGALTESQHVYVDCGWRAFETTDRPINVFEVGFGSGLNAALTAIEAEAAKTPTFYSSVELYPLDSETIRLITAAYSDGFKSALDSVNSAPWETIIEINSYFTLHKIQADLLRMEIPSGIDVVYFDAFAPEKQSEMWSEDTFRKIFEAMNPGGVLTTYCAKGIIRRMLQEIGFRCERLSGPPGGKREILRAHKECN